MPNGIKFDQINYVLLYLPTLAFGIYLCIISIFNETMHAIVSWSLVVTTYSNSWSSVTVETDVVQPSIVKAKVHGGSSSSKIAIKYAIQRKYN